MFSAYFSVSLYTQTIPVYFQPFLFLFIIWYNLLYQFPEIPTMVGMDQMSQFMYYYVIHYKKRGHNQSPVEVKITFTAAASPSCLLVPDIYFIISNIHYVYVQFYPFLIFNSGLFFVPLY